MTMSKRLPTTVAVVLTVVLAGCAGGIGGDSSPDATTTATTATSTPTETSTLTATTTTTTAEPTPTGTPTYVPPITPNRPTQTADEAGNRIKGGTFVNKTEAKNGSGYTDFDVRIRANTSMHNVDPPEVREHHGDVEGEPYAVVIVNGKLVERSRYFEMKDDGQFDISVHPDGLRRAGVKPGTLKVKVLLMDQDSDRDDVFGTWTGTIEYAGYAGAA